MKKYVAEIESLGESMIWNCIREEMELEKKQVKKTDLKQWEEDNWVRKAEIDKDDNVLIPSRWIRSAMHEACMKSRMIPLFEDSKKATFTRYIGNNVQFKVLDPVCKKDDLTQCRKLMSSQPGKKGSGKVLRIRPQLEKPWATRIEIADLDGRMSKGELESLLNYAGLYMGFGDERSLGCGRWQLTKLNEMGC